MDELKKLLHLLVSSGSGRLIGEAEQVWARNVIDTHPLLNPPPAPPAEALKPAAEDQAAEGTETAEQVA